MDKLVKLPRFSYTELDFDTIIEDVEEFISQHPEYLDNWDDFLETNAGRMILELSAYIAEKVAAKADWYAREMFISTATQKESIINILKLINYRPPLPKAAKMSVNLKMTKWAESFYLKAGETISVKDKNGILTDFECIDIADDGKPNYEFKYRVNTGDVENKIYLIENIPFYQGTTRVEDDIWMDGINNERYSLAYSPVIGNSVRVFSQTRNKEFIEVDSFISAEAQQNDVDPAIKTIPYRVEVTPTNGVEIVFGHDNLVEIPKKGERIKITYRTGGGANTNVPANTLNSTKTYKLGGERITLLFTNPKSAVGGNDAEDIDNAKLVAPLKLRTANKTVTNEDYIITVEDDSSVMHTTVVSKDNEPGEIFQEYGHFLPPLDTWIYITPIREGYDEAPTTSYNRILKLSKTYDEHYVVDYEDVKFYPSKQNVLLKKYRQNSGYPMAMILYQDSDTSFSWLDGQPFEEEVDYMFNPITSEITRIQSVDDGRIPAPDSESQPTICRVLWVNDSSWDSHKQNTVFTFTNDPVFNRNTITLNTKRNSLYPNKDIEVWDIKGDKKYSLYKDYEINYEFNKIIRVDGSDIDDDEKVVVYYADNWDPEKICEESYYLDNIKNKKMLCVDNYIKDSRYSSFDVVVTVTVHKNMKGTVSNEIFDTMRAKYSLDNREYGMPISRSQISSDIMSIPGVRMVDIEYLGKDYHLYQKNSLGDITDEELDSMMAQNHFKSIPAKYNEIIVLADDEWDGIEINENKKHGLIVYYEEM